MCMERKTKRVLKPIELGPNHCAGNAGVPRLYLYARVRISHQHCTRDRWCSKHPAFPAPSQEGQGSCKPRTQTAPREGEVMITNVDATEFAMPGKEPRQRDEVACSFSGFVLRNVLPEHAFVALQMPF